MELLKHLAVEDANKLLVAEPPADAVDGLGVRRFEDFRDICTLSGNKM